ncbi:hypothetical protein QO002_003669 [Pararhizobium capsulatum DSM 1112]|uniref:Transmembrane protein n=1 Tax=Pararhizobium capsulatum DSM 1112 TaxID=1121113 RepID=A0ABU0BV19_9HYPH|nr:hypothetical protein [Pararhizobium capsulatum]MDQ0321531.1 hypothetical protein [Pararhizobium capsulatum DSM 1112]
MCLLLRGDDTSMGAANARRLFYAGSMKRWLRYVFLLFVFLQAADVLAHSGRLAGGPVSGIPIPNLSHGEMAVLTKYHGDIMGAADRVTRTDPSFRRLQNYAAIQYSYCLWGVAPGAITDEESPFNQCAHAYLAAGKALLLHMRDMPDASFAIAQLVSKIDREMIEAGAAFIGCKYSGESFNTAEFLTPHWENVPAHMPTMAVVTGMLIVLVFPIFLGIAHRSSLSMKH